jgi:hypothetical protein
MNPYSLTAAWMIEGGWSQELRRTERDLAHRRALIEAGHANDPRPALSRRTTLMAELLRPAPVVATLPVVDCGPACA